MTYALLVKKFERLGGTFVTRETLMLLCGELGMGYIPAVGYLTSNRYIVRIMRGIFYVKGIEERKLDTLKLNHLEAIREAMTLKGVGNWYFGLETAASLGNLAHEYFTITSVISDSIGRSRPFEIMGHKVRFIKVSRNLFGFGVISANVPHSDPEKTLLDMVYLGRYNGLSEAEISGNAADLLKHCSWDKLHDYGGKYPKTVMKFLERMR